MLPKNSTAIFEHRFCSRMCRSTVHIDKSTYNGHPGVDSASNRNEYQEHFLGVKLAGA